MSAINRLYDITLEDAYKQVFRKCAYGRWNVKGNYMNIDIPRDIQNVETWVFLGESIFILGLSAEKDGMKVMVSLTDFMDIWQTVKMKYPQLFQENVKGDLCTI